MKKFILLLLLLTAVICVLLLTLQHYFGQNLVHPWSFFFVLYFFLFTLTIHFFLYTKIPSGNLVGPFIVSVVLRIVISASLIMPLLNAQVILPKVLISNFFIIYLCFTWFEISVLMANLRAHFKRKKNRDNNWQ